MAWTSSVATHENWRRLSVVTDANNDVDFQLRVDDQFPSKVWDHDPQSVQDAEQESP